jgi:hypothetical protein
MKVLYPRPFMATAVFLLLSLAAAASGAAAERSSTLSIVFENDLFYHADRDYTNGVEVSWSPRNKAAEILPVSIQTVLSDVLDLRLPPSRSSESAPMRAFYMALWH